MNSPLPFNVTDKLQEILKTLAEYFKIPLVFFDTSGTELFRINTVETDQTGFAVPRQEGEMVSAPIRYMGDVIGNLAVPHELPAGSDIASHAAFCMEKFLKFETELEDLSSEIVRVYEELSLLYSLTNKLGSEMDVDTICRQVLEETDKILSARNLCILLYEPESGRLITRNCSGIDADAARHCTIDGSSGFFGRLLSQGQPVTVCDISTDPRFMLPFPARSILCVPLITDDRAIGMLIASDKLSGEEFWSRELKLMGMFASEVASSIKKAQLYEEINRIFISTVEAFASAIDAKDPYTYGHSRRVAQLSVAICNELEMPKKRSRLVELAAFLHDIGKIGTPESILHKPGVLHPDEFEKIKEHPAKGADILSNISGFQDIIKWIKHHHEWYDGKGYPDRIAAEEIPIEARIITIADAYDAMTSDRPYRKGMPPEEVLKIMEGFTRSQFDPDILAAFKRLMDEGRIED